MQLQDSRKLWFLLKVRWFPGIARNQVEGLLRQAQRPVRGERLSRSKAGAFAEHNLLERRKNKESELPVSN